MLVQSRVLAPLTVVLKAEIDSPWRLGEAVTEVWNSDILSAQVTDGDWLLWQRRWSEPALWPGKFLRISHYTAPDVPWTPGLGV